MLKVCRDNSFVSGGIQNLPRVISLEHIIERVRHPSPTSPVAAADTEDSETECCGADDIPCQLCDDGTRLPRRAVKSCLHCNASYCTTCLKVGCCALIRYHIPSGLDYFALSSIHNQTQKVYKPRNYNKQMPVPKCPCNKANKKAQLTLSNPRDVKACQNCSNSTCFVSFHRIPFPQIANA